MDKTNGVAVVAIVVVLGIQIARVEVQVVSIRRFIGRTRPIVAVGAGVVDIRRIAVARSRQDRNRIKQSLLEHMGNGRGVLFSARMD